MLAVVGAVGCILDFPGIVVVSDLRPCSDLMSPSRGRRVIEYEGW